MNDPTVIDPRIQRFAQEWRQNRRLRVGALAILLIVGTHLVLTLSDLRQARVDQYQNDAELLGRLEEASRESAWPERAQSAEARLVEVKQSIPTARSDGLAQAEMQAWLTDLAAFAGLDQPRVRVETSLPVPGQEEMWQVLARLDATVPEGRAPTLVRALSSALPWVATERLEIQSGSASRVSLLVRGYFRQAAEGDAEAPPPRPANLPDAPVGPNVTPGRPANPLARPDAPRERRTRKENPR